MPPLFTSKFTKESSRFYWQGFSSLFSKRSGPQWVWNIPMAFQQVLEHFTRLFLSFLHPLLQVSLLDCQWARSDIRSEVAVQEVRITCLQNVLQEVFVLWPVDKLSPLRLIYHGVHSVSNEADEITYSPWSAAVPWPGCQSLEGSSSKVFLTKGMTACWKGHGFYPKP